LSANRPIDITSRCVSTKARAGVLRTSHGDVTTPTFMPVGTQGTVKSLTPCDLREIGAGIVLGNTYHLYLRPGISTVGRFGGLHGFMAWDGPILTDSGGYQVFSLAALRRIGEEGVSFCSHVDGSEHFLTPELAVDYQERLGSDIAMVLDVCHPHDLGLAGTREAMERTHRWAERCLNSHRRQEQLLFAIVQGGTSVELRLESARFLTSLPFPGYAIGGLSVGEPKATTWAVLERTIDELPADRPRYFMGVGAPDDIVRSVAMGVDMFDSVLPTRVARHGAVFTPTGRVNLRNSIYRESDESLDATCDCYTCHTFPVAYLHHLFKCEELLAYRLATLHNLRFMVSHMHNIRQAIVEGRFAEFKEKFLSTYKPSDEQVRLEQKRKWFDAAGGRKAGVG